jgi:hypothetical protein
MPYFARQTLVQVTTSTITTTPSHIVRANSTTINNTFLNYENNSTLGIKIKYPSDWQRVQLDDIGVLFRTSPKSHPDRFLERCLVAVFPYNGNDASVNDLASRAINNYIEYNSDFQLIKSQVISFKGNPAYMLLYTYSDGSSMKVVSMDLGIPKGDKVHVISYLCRTKTIQQLHANYTEHD